MSKSKPFTSISLPNHELTMILQDYAKEYVRLSLLGVDNINQLTECTKVLPPAIKTFNSPDSAIIKAWLKGRYDVLGKYLENGDLLTGIFALLGLSLN